MVDGLSAWMRSRLDRLKLSDGLKIWVCWFRVTDEISSLLMKLSGDRSQGNDNAIAGTGESSFSIPALCSRQWRCGVRLTCAPPMELQQLGVLLSRVFMV